MSLFKNSITLTAAALTLSLAQSAFAESYWDHNGSLMRLEHDGDYRAFYYVRPSAKVAKLGVVRGDLLFSGYRQGNRYYGTAYAFPRSCGYYPTPYSVAGTVGRGEKSIHLQGIFQGCDGTTKRDTLNFTFLY